MEMIDDEAEAINEIIIKREKAKREGNEVEAKEIEELLKKAGFEIKDKKDSTVVTRKKANV
jgi:cysteinyl-tRNA synthetase